MTDLNADPRWRRLQDSSFQCPCCNRSFDGVFDIAFDHPLPWPHGSRSDTGESEIVVGDDVLTSDLCTLGTDRFIRALFPIPIIGSSETFAFGVWGSASADSFAAYVAAWKAGDYTSFNGCFSWLSNLLPTFDQVGAVPCNLVLSDGQGQRPLLYVQSDSGEEHQPLLRAQRDGITFDRLLDIYAAAGEDIRPHLLDS